MTKMGTSGAGIGAFRAAFGALLCISIIRFWLNGWIEEIYIEPSFHFGFVAGIEPWETPWIYVHFAAMFCAAFGLAIGCCSRGAAAVFFALFTCVELWDKSAYLNHYYLVSVLALWLVLVPSDGYFSVRPSTAHRDVDRRIYTWLRIQVSLVYFFAGFAKLNHDWLIHGEPLATWLRGYAFLSPVSVSTVAIAMSWGGAAFDLTVWIAMWNRRTRKPAFAVACLFHAIVGMLFPIGVFPFVMVLSLTLFFESDWCKLGQKSDPAMTVELHRATKFVAIALLTIQLAVPLRFVFYAGHPNWTNDGFRFAWRVMLVEKRAHARFVVVTSEARIRVFPRDDLRDFQYHQMSFQPDMIHQYAAALRSRYERLGHKVERVEATVTLSFNGRASIDYLVPGDASRSVEVVAQPECERH